MQAANGKLVELIDDQKGLERLCDSLSDVKYLAFDTEFVRTNTFYPKLGLLQIADPVRCYLVDPLRILSWNDFTLLLENNNVTFCIHSCSEDLNLLHTSINSMPVRLFDSQIAAAFLGLGFSLSYQGLVLQLLDKSIPKDETRSDWMKRPLSNAQLQYAANDVCYLLDLKEILWDKLVDKKVIAWFEEECANQVALAEEFERKENWKKSFVNISKSWKLADDNLYRLQKLCFWREIKARESNKPRNWIAKDSDLFDIANHEFKSISVSDMEYLDLSDNRFVFRYGKEIVELLANDQSNIQTIDRAQLSTPLQPSLRKKLKCCQTVVKELADKLSLAPELLARKRLLQGLVRDFDNYGELRWQGELGGWRRELLEPAVRKFFQ